MNCGCGKYDERHQPSDITLEDMQKAADGQGMDMEQAADNIHESAQAVRKQKPS